MDNVFGTMQVTSRKGYLIIDYDGKTYSIPCDHLKDFMLVGTNVWYVWVFWNA